MNEQSSPAYHRRKLKAAMQRTTQPIPPEVLAGMVDVLRFLERCSDVCHEPEQAYTAPTQRKPH